MGNCVAGGGYLPVLCDKLLMTEGSGPVSGRSGAGQSRHRPGRRQRGPRRREDARRRSAARSTSANPTTTRAWPACAAGRIVAADPQAAAVPPQSTVAPGQTAATNCISIVTREPRRRIRGPRSACRACSMPGRSRNTRPNSARRWSAATAGWAAFAVGIVANQHHAAKPAEGPCSSAASSITTAPTRRPASSWTATRRWTPLIFLQDV